MPWDWSVEETPHRKCPGEIELGVQLAEFSRKPRNSDLLIPNFGNWPDFRILARLALESSPGAQTSMFPRTRPLITKAHRALFA